MPVSPIQLRLLKTLSKHTNGLTRKQLAQKAKMNSTWFTKYIGSNDEAIRSRNDEEFMPSLLTLGLVRAKDFGEGVVYFITAKGKKAAQSAA